MVCNAVDDGSFKTDPEIKTNCVRVYYDDGPHVDIPVYRSTTDWSGNDKYELASVDWKESNPEGVNSWFREWIMAKKADGMARSRELIRLLKAICKEPPLLHHPPQRLRTHRGWSRNATGVLMGTSTSNCGSWIEAIHRRLGDNLTVAHPVVSGEWLIDDDTKHRTTKLRELLGMAVEELAALDRPNCTRSETLKAWRKVFCTDFFDQGIADAEAEEKERTSVAAGGVVFAPKSYGYSRDVMSVTEEVASRRARPPCGRAFPALKLDTSAEPVTVTGTLWLESGFGFSVDLWILDDYPEGIPRLICRPEEIPWEVDRHVCRGRSRMPLRVFGNIVFTGREDRT